MSSPLGVVTIRANEYPGADLTVLLNEDIPRVNGGIAKWNQVERPRRRDALEFTSEDPLVLTFGVMFDRWASQESVENEVGRLYGWAAKIKLEEPPTIRLSGPLPYTELGYKLTKIVDDGEVLRRADGLRCRQELKLEFTEYVATDIIAQNRSPVAAAVAASAPAAGSPAPAGGGSTYVVAKGDTLSGIAAKKLGKASRWPEIAKLNSLANPNKISVGQVLKLP